MKRRILAVLLVAAAASAQAPAPSVVVKQAREIDFKASGSLPPGAEYHLIYEDPKTKAVQTLVRMPSGYALPKHSHSHDETLLVLKGKVTLSFEGGSEKTLGPGGYAVIPGGTRFSLAAKGFGGVEFLAAFAGPYDAK